LKYGWPEDIWFHVNIPPSCLLSRLCLVLSCFISVLFLSCLGMAWLAFFRLALPCLVVYCLVLSWHGLACVFPSCLALSCCILYCVVFSAKKIRILFFFERLTTCRLRTFTCAAIAHMPFRRRCVFVLEMVVFCLLVPCLFVARLFFGLVSGLVPRLILSFCGPPAYTSTRKISMKCRALSVSSLCLSTPVNSL
jgi:hypothetical protein